MRLCFITEPGQFRCVFSTFLKPQSLQKKGQRTKFKKKKHTVKLVVFVCIYIYISLFLAQGQLRLYIILILLYLKPQKSILSTGVNQASKTMAYPRICDVTSTLCKVLLTLCVVSTQLLQSKASQALVQGDEEIDRYHAQPDRQGGYQRGDSGSKWDRREEWKVKDYQRIGRRGR